MKEKKYGLFKLVAIMLLVAIFLTWLIPSGSLTATGLVEQSVLRFGLNDLVWLVYYSIYMGLDKIIFLLFLGGMYGVLTHLNAYKSLVNKIAKAFNKHKKVVVVLLSVVIGLLTSFLTNEFVVLIFIPFIISILHEMKLDKMTILTTTFGSMLVGVLGATFGTDGMLVLGSSFTSSTKTIHDVIYDTLLVRGAILAIGLFLFNFFTLNHMKKSSDKESATMFEVEVSENKKASVIPLVLVGVLLFIIAFIGYTGWVDNFNVSIFNDFQDFLYNVKIGDSFYIIKNILGEYPDTISSWNLYIIPPIMFIFTVILALCYRVKLNDFIGNAIEGIKKVVKPILVVMAFYSLVLVVYMSPYVATIAYRILSLSEGFNLATMLLTSIVVNIFHPDLAYTGQVLVPYLSAEYLDYINPIMVMLSSIHGLIQFFVPTSIFLGIGLTTLNVNYKDWLKYIWKFLLGMFIVLLIIIILITII